MLDALCLTLESGRALLVRLIQRLNK